MKPSIKEVEQAIDRTSILYDSIVGNVVRHSVYKLDKEFAKHIDDVLDSLSRAQSSLKEYGSDIKV